MLTPYRIWVDIVAARYCESCERAAPDDAAARFELWVVACDHPQLWRALEEVDAGLREEREFSHAP